MQALSVATTENWPACLGHYRRRGDAPYKKRYAYVPNGGALGACLETISYGYDAAHQDWADQLTSYNGEAIRYDDSGNPISYRGYTMAWQGKRLTSATKTGTAITYSYDENGIRTQKTVNGVSTNYYYNGSVLISQVTGNDTLLFSYDASGSVVSVNFNGTDYYYVRNGQGDVVKLIDGNGATVTEYTYDTWGKQLSCTGSLASTLGAQNPFRYRGYVYDTETGWYYLQSRYYDPEVCRFISADVFLSTGQGVLGHNTFAYCLNNPVNRSDPSGCACIIDDPNTRITTGGLTEYTDARCSKIRIRYNVPYYYQGMLSLCWAFCQVMVESYYMDRTLASEQVLNRAMSLARAENGDANWNSGDWPTNYNEQPIIVDSITQLHSLLINSGPLYALYENTETKKAHLVVVIGVDVLENKVYVNNPNNPDRKTTVQTFEEFCAGFVVRDKLYDGFILSAVYTIEQ